MHNLTNISLTWINQYKIGLILLEVTNIGWVIFYLADGYRAIGPGWSWSLLKTRVMPKWTWPLVLMGTGLSTLVTGQPLSNTRTVCCSPKVCESIIQLQHFVGKSFTVVDFNHSSQLQCGLTIALPDYACENGTLLCWKHKKLNAVNSKTWNWHGKPCVRLT